MNLQDMLGLGCAANLRPGTVESLGEVRMHRDPRSEAQAPWPSPRHRPERSPAPDPLHDPGQAMQAWIKESWGRLASRLVPSMDVLGSQGFAQLHKPQKSTYPTC